jgi:DNA-directed RNA polymerase specialized sigma24 family protein
LQWAVLGERLSLLSEALRELSYEQREVICFRMELDLPFRRIAKLQKVSINTVKGRYRYGIKRLRSLLNHEVER